MTFHFSPVHEKGCVLQGRRTQETQPDGGRAQETFEGICLIS